MENEVVLRMYFLIGHHLPRKENCRGIEMCQMGSRNYNVTGQNYMVLIVLRVTGMHHILHVAS